MPVDKPSDTPTVFKNAKAFDTWLRQHHATSAGLWLKKILGRGETVHVFKPKVKVKKAEDCPGMMIKCALAQ